MPHRGSSYTFLGSTRKATTNNQHLQGCPEGFPGCPGAPNSWTPGEAPGGQDLPRFRLRGDTPRAPKCSAGALSCKSLL
eukprot:7978625-Alexandrium_andersonii.AAC.1